MISNIHSVYQGSKSVLSWRCFLKEKKGSPGRRLLFLGKVYLFSGLTFVGLLKLKYY